MTAADWPTLTMIQHRASYDVADAALQHIEESFPLEHPARLEMNAVRRKLAGVFCRMEDLLRSEYEQTRGKTL